MSFTAMQEPTTPEPVARGRRHWEPFLLAWLVYVVAARLGLLVASPHGSVSPVWPATGVAIATLSALGVRAWPVVAAGAAVTTLWIQTPLWTSLGIVVASTLEAIAGALLYRRAARWQPPGGERLVDPLAMAITAAGAALVGATLGVGSLWLGGVIGTDVAGRALLTWWVGDALGALTVVPLARDLRTLVHTAWNRRAVLRGALLLALVTVTAAAVFLRQDVASLLFLLLPLLLLVMDRSGPSVAQLAVLVIAGFCIAGTSLGDGPFTRGLRNDNLLHAQVFLATCTITVMTLGAFEAIGRRRLPLVLLIGGWLASGGLFAMLRDRAEQDDRTRFDLAAREGEERLLQQFHAYGDALRSGVSLLLASQSVERDEWRAFCGSLRSTEYSPGILGLGVVVPVRRDAVAGFVARARADGAPDFTLHTLAQEASRTSDEHYVVQFVEPEADNRLALGLDLASERERRVAAEEARDTGEITMTGRITLVQDTHQRAGQLLFAPVYRRGAATDTVAARRAALQAWVYAPFVIDELLDGIGGRDDRLRLAAYQGRAPDPAALIAGTLGPATTLTRISHRQLLRRDFTLAWQPGPGFTAASDATAIWAACGAALITLLLACLVLSLQSVGDSAEQLVLARTAELEYSRDRMAAQAVDLEAALAAAQEATRAKSDFLASMSHEIRTPMNGVLGMARLLADTRLDADQADCVRTILGSGEALLTLLNDILDFSKIEAGKLQIEPIPFDLQAAIAEVCDLMVARAEEKGLELLLRFAPTTPARLVGDPGRIRQILMNLVGNAIKFTASGHVLVDVNPLPGTDAHGVRISVTDTGIGITTEARSRLFQKFSQADASTTRRFGGTGLGLAISKQLTMLMGGEIDVESTPGHGSTFWFTLPLPRPEGEPPTAATEPPLAGLRVLVADGHPLRRNILMEQLGAWGAQCDTAMSAAHVDRTLAAARATGKAFQVVLLEDTLPGENGESMGRRLMAPDPAGNGPAVLLLVPPSRRSATRTLREIGFAAVLHRPLRPQVLLDAVAATRSNDPRTARGGGAALRDGQAEQEEFGLRVLVADDNVVNQKVAARMLERLGCRVDVAANGCEAVTLHAQLPYDLILMDCQMPEMDGFAAAAEIRRREAGGRRIPILAVTANAMQGDREECLAAGMDDHVSKPIKFEALVQALRTWSSRASAATPSVT